MSEYFIFHQMVKHFYRERRKIPNFGKRGPDFDGILQGPRQYCIRVNEHAEPSVIINIHEIFMLKPCLLMGSPKDKASIEVQTEKKTRRICVRQPTPLRLCAPSVYVSVSQSERVQRCLQSRCCGAQMHVQSRVLCSLNSVNPSAVPKLRTQASPVFSPLSRIFTLSHQASRQDTFSTLNLPPPSFLVVNSVFKLMWKNIFPVVER